MTNKPKICFVSPYIYPLFNPDNKTMFGGFEVRIATIARELVKRGNFEVSIIVADHGQPHRETRDGVELISWQGKAFYGITRQTPETLAPVAETPTAQSARPPAEPASNQAVYVSENISTVHSNSLRSRIKKIYKRVVPWRVRIIVTGLLVGLKEGLKEVLRFWIHAVKNFVWGIRSSIYIFRERVRQALRIARTAAGNMGDLPVFHEDLRAYAEAEADVYLVPGNNRISAEIAFFSKKWNKAFIMLVGSDMDLNPEYLLNPYGVDLYSEPNALKLYSVQNADAHMVQNERQMNLAARYGISPVLIRNPLNLDRAFPKVENSGLILWVGSTDERVKRPSLLIAAARRLPQYRFLMIITPTVPEDYERLRETASALPNLEIISRVPFHEVEKYYAQAKLFVNTSSFEGFPNTFLQAGKYAVPIISLNVDPNTMLSQHRCGFTCENNLELLISNIQKLMSDSGEYTGASQRILDYVRQNHDKDVIIPQIEEQFRKVLGRKKMA